MKTFAFASTVLSALPLLARAATTPDRAAAVRNAITHVDKINALTDEEFVFDFKDPNLKKTTGAGGTLTSANVGNFAALVGNGLALTIGEMAPCGANSPHSHPRATEILLLLNGELSAGFLTENGSRFVVQNLTEYSAMVFPAGSIHFQANYGCDPIKFVAALSDEDPGTLQVAQRYFALPADVVGASLGGLGVQEVEDLASKIPDNMIAGTKECYQRCNIPFPSQPTKQQQPKPTATGTTTGTTTSTSQPSQTYAPAPPPTKNVIDVIVGKDLGLTYTSDNIEAPVGSTVRFTFVSKNHTVTESAFDKPCDPRSDGFDSGFMPIPAGSNEVKTWDLEITHDKPIWFYCKQRAAGAPKGHCALGMNGAINAPKSGPKTLAEFKKLAEKST